MMKFAEVKLFMKNMEVYLLADSERLADNAARTKGNCANNAQIDTTR
jgi:hypothetical protein